jgi:hypothetical protein
MKFLVPEFINEWRIKIRQQGLKKFIKSKGWKIVLVFFVFYAVRDIILYIIIPYLVISRFPSC